MAKSGYYAYGNGTWFKWVGLSGNSITYSFNHKGVKYFYPGTGNLVEDHWYQNQAWQKSTRPANSTPDSTITLGMWYGCYPTAQSSSTVAISACTFVDISVSVASGQGTVSGGGSNFVSGQQPVSISATPANNWRFLQWSDGNTNAARAFPAMVDLHLTATFVRSHYIISATSGGFNATVTASGGGSSQTGNSVSITVPANASCTVTCNPASLYRFSSWSVSGGGTLTSNPHSFTATADLHFGASVILTFRSVSVSSQGAGRAIVGQSGESTERFYENGDTVTVRAIPDNAMETAFSHWTYQGNPISTLATYVFTMGSQAVALVAVFVEKAYPITVVSAKSDPEDAGVWGDVSITANGETSTSSDEVLSIAKAAYWVNNPCVIEAVAREHGVFHGWEDQDENQYLDEKLFLNFTDVFPRVFAAMFAEAALFDLSVEVGEGGQPGSGPQNAVSIKSHKGQSEGQYYEGFVEVEAIAVVGWRLKQWNATGFDSIQLGDDGFDSVFRFLLARNTIVTAFFELNQYDVSWNVEAPSVGKGTIAADYRLNEGYEYDSYNAGVDLFYYGSQVKLVAEPETGSVFIGWYSPSGTLISSDATATITVTDTAFYVARFGASATAATSGTGTASTATVSKTLFAYGETVTFTAIANNGEFFKGWYEAGTLKAGYGRTVVVAPTADLTLTAKFDVDSDPFYVMLTNEAVGYGRLDLEGVGAESMTAESAWKSTVDGIFGAANLVQNKYFKFNDLSVVSLSATPLLSSISFLRFDLIPMVEDGGIWQEDAVNTLPLPDPGGAVLTGTCKLKAIYMSAIPATVTLTYVTGGGIEDGALGFSRRGVNESGGVVVQASFVPGSSVSAVALPKSGYKFAGWFTAQAGTGSAVSTKMEFPLSISAGGATYYAKFTQDASAIYEWEGDTVSKRLTWRSKRHVSTRPFNPTSAIVDADFYPVVLSVATASSPDSALSRQVSITVAGKTPRRLPVVRPEKYVEISVQSVGVVNEVAVGTSMEGIR